MIVNAKNVGGLLTDVELYIDSQIDSKNMKESSVGQYKQIINDFIQWVLYSNKSIEIMDVFSETNIIKYREKRKSDIVRSVHRKFLDFSLEKEYINEQQFHEVNKIISKVYKSNKKQTIAKFLRKEEVDSLFHNMYYKKEDEGKKLKIISMMAFYLYFGQTDMYSLKISDYIPEKSLIKNPSALNNDLLKKWLIIPSELKESLDDYLSGIDDDLYLLSKTSTPYKTDYINNILSKTKTNGNHKRFREGYSPISAELLIKSGLLYSLQETKGESLFYLVSICGYNDHVKDAIKRYSEWYQAQNIDVYDDIVFTDIKKGFTNIADDDYYEQDIVDESDSDNKDFSYTENKDITWETLMDYDSFNNQKSTEISIERLVRNTKKSEILKALYENKCQLCEYRLMNDKGGYYSEVHHIKPYNKTHKGDDIESNMIVLCPNCHVLFDKLVYAINPDDNLVNCLYEDDQYHLSELKLLENHVLDTKYLKYVWELFLEKKENLNNRHNK